MDISNVLYKEEDLNLLYGVVMCLAVAGFFRILWVHNTKEKI